MEAIIKKRLTILCFKDFFVFVFHILCFHSFHSKYTSENCRRKKQIPCFITNTSGPWDQIGVGFSVCVWTMWHNCFKWILFVWIWDRAICCTSFIHAQFSMFVQTFGGWAGSVIELVLTNNALIFQIYPYKNENPVLLFLKGQMLYPEGCL